jgi:hypothetical protein
MSFRKSRDSPTSLRENTRPYRYHGLKIFTSLKLRFQDFQRWRETQTIDHTSSDKSMETNNIENMTEEELDARLDELERKLNEG